MNWWAYLAVLAFTYLLCCVTQAAAASLCNWVRRRINLRFGYVAPEDAQWFMSDKNKDLRDKVYK